jgi:hypothetical protein
MNISKEQIEQNIAALISAKEASATSLHYGVDKAQVALDISDINETLTMLQGLLDQPEGEPVGIVVYKPKMLRVGALNTAGMALPDGTRLYTHPAPFTPITADDVTAEMVDAYIRQRHSFKDHRVVIATVVNAYMKGKQ